MLLCHTGLALSSSVAGFGVSLSSVSFLIRSSFVIFIFSLFVCSFILLLGPQLHPMCLAQDTGLYLCCQFHAQFRFVLARFKFHFFVLWLSILLKFIWYGHHHPRHVLVASNRPPFVLIRPYIRIRATLLRIAAPAKLPHVILRIVDQPLRPALTWCRRLITPRFRCLSPRYSWSLVRHKQSYVVTTPPS